MNNSFSPDISKRNSFDFLRFFFAFSVFLTHFDILTSPDGRYTFWPVDAPMGVAGFFIISGFLITRSYYRSANLWDYTQKRICRIVPAYFFIVISCAVFLSFVSSLSFQEYFTSKELYKYLAANLGFMNFIQPYLPGVFTANFFSSVNGALWTIKIEIALYACVPLLALFLKRKPILAFIGIYVFSFLFVFYMRYLYENSGKEIYTILRTQFLGQIRFFISGVILLFYFDFIKKHIKWFLPFSIFIFITRYFVFNLVIDFFYPISFAVLIISFAYYFKKLGLISKYGDFSYGMYLYHYPIIQLFIYFGRLNENPIVLFLVCFCSVLLLSCLSWHLLEKRFLKRKM
jgi:peptidoglycan/LPS O-acetylase OafA/YrhL